MPQLNLVQEMADYFYKGSRRVAVVKHLLSQYLEVQLETASIKRCKAASPHTAGGTMMASQARKHACPC